MVLVGADAAALGAVLAGAPDRDGHERLLAVMVGDPRDPAVRCRGCRDGGRALARAGAAERRPRK